MGDCSGLADRCDVRLGVDLVMGPRIIPSTVKAALRFVGEHHRHLPALQGGLFACGLKDGDQCGVAIAGNPSRMWQGTGRFVITRVATRETVNDFGPHSAPYCSMLLSAICRAGAALGYSEAWTYTLPEESGVSLKAAGFINMGLTDGGEWDRPSRSRKPAVRPEPKRRWMRPLSAEARANLGDQQ